MTDAGLAETKAGDKVLTAGQAAKRLGVTTATLYAYVSRGLIAPIRAESDQIAGASQKPSRQKRSLFRQSDIDALRADRRRPRARAEIAAGTLTWGEPVLESALTLIRNGRLYYRGQDVATLAARATLEEVAELLWGARWPHSNTALPPPAIPPTLKDPMDRAQAAIALVAGQDLAAWDTAPDSLTRTGARIVTLLAETLGAGGPTTHPLHQRLALGWNHGEAADSIRQALVLCADHELNASTFAARVVAGTGATLYHAVLAGIAALQGPRHGGMTRQVAALFDRAQSAGTAHAAELVGDLLRRGETLPGFGHPLYPAGDVRAQTLLAGPVGRQGTVASLASAGRRLTGKAPTIDFALVGVERTFALPRGSAQALFLLGRSIGWIAHAREQLLSGKMIRPRASYSGIMP